MLTDRSVSRYGRNIYLLKRIKAISTFALIILAVTLSIFIIIRVKSGTVNEKRELLRVWNAGEYELSYQISKDALKKRPIDYFFLTMNGFSAYQLGISQINNQNTLEYVDESIFSLRKAMLQTSAKSDARIFYVLGKAYAYKGTEYSDLAIKYLTMAGNMSFNAADIPEYLGLAYAASGDYRASVEAFSQAFNQNETPSDNLMLSIARSYISLNENAMAMGYLRRCIDSSPDSKSIVIARFLLAEIYKNTGDYDGAEEQYLVILNEGSENAEARFQLGELYNLKRDMTTDARERQQLYTIARSYWREANRLDPAHAGARARLL